MQAPRTINAKAAQLVCFMARHHTHNSGATSLEDAAQVVAEMRGTWGFCSEKCPGAHRFRWGGYRSPRAVQRAETSPTAPRHQPDTAAARKVTTFFRGAVVSDLAPPAAPELLAEGVIPVVLPKGHAHSSGELLEAADDLSIGVDVQHQ